MTKRAALLFRDAECLAVLATRVAALRAPRRYECLGAIRGGLDPSQASRSYRSIHLGGRLPFGLRPPLPVRK
jgi:hypothetical protein